MTAGLTPSHRLKGVVTVEDQTRTTVRVAEDAEPASCQQGRLRSTD